MDTELKGQKELSELDRKKQFLHKLIDDITIADYVEANTRLLDVSQKTQTIHQIVIEKGGNILISPRPRHFHFDDDDDLE